MGTISMAITAVLTSLIPHVNIITSNALLLMLCLFFVNGCLWGAMESGANMMLLHTWGKEISPFMQGLTFAFGVGGLASPLIARPFLIEADVEHLPDFEGHLFDNRSLSFNTSDAPSYTVLSISPDDLLLVYPYTIIAGVLAVSAAWMFVILCFWRHTEEHPSRKQQIREMSSSGVPEGSDDRDNNLNDNLSRDKGLPDLCITSSSLQRNQQPKNFKSKKLIAVILTMVLSHVYYGLELAMGSFLVPFSVESDLKLSKAEGTKLTSLFWATFTFWRLTAIFYIEYIGNEMNIWLSLITILIGNVLLIPFGNTNELCLWIGVAIIGLGTSSMWSCMFGYLESYFPVTSKIASALIVSALIGEFIFPLLISYFIASDPMVFMWVTLALSFSLILSFIAVSYMMRFQITNERFSFVRRK
jgi:hypothetical protein